MLVLITSDSRYFNQYLRTIGRTNGLVVAKDARLHGRTDCPGGRRVWSLAELRGRTTALGRAGPATGRRSGVSQGHPRTFRVLLPRLPLRRAPAGAASPSTGCSTPRPRTPTGGSGRRSGRLVRHEFMPPAHADRPTDGERRAIARWVEREVFQVDEARPDPGRVTIRRLNRMEYQYTVRDLFGIDLDLAQELPPDDTAFGFDNIGDAQTLSPALLETYLTLAEKVVAAAIVEDGPRHPRVQVRPTEFQPKAAAEEVEPGRAGGRGRTEARRQVPGRTPVRRRRLAGVRRRVRTDRHPRRQGGRREEDAQRRRQQDVHALRRVTLARASTNLSSPPSPVKADADGKLAAAAAVAAGRSSPGRSAPESTSTPSRTPGSSSRVPAPADAKAKRAYAREILARVAARAFRRPAVGRRPRPAHRHGPGGQDVRGRRRPGGDGRPQFARGSSSGPSSSRSRTTRPRSTRSTSTPSPRGCRTSSG